MSDKIGLFTGSFDPVTKGHLDLIERASRLFDKLYVGMFYNQEKKSFFDLDAKERMLRESLSAYPNVEVFVSTQELAVKRAKELGVTSLVRGVRNATDLEYEANLAYFNHELEPKIETIFLLSRPDYLYLSSSRVRELIAFGQDVAAYVPTSVVKELENK